MSTNQPFCCTPAQEVIRGPNIPAYRKKLDEGEQTHIKQREKPTVGTILVFHIQFAKTKVTKCNVAGVVQQNIFRLEVSIDDVEPMQTFEGAKEFGRIES